MHVDICSHRLTRCNYVVTRTLYRQGFVLGHIFASHTFGVHVDVS